MIKIVETAVEIEKIIESHCTNKLVMRFGFLYMHFNVNLCLRKNCYSCKFVNDFATFLLRTNFSAEKKCLIFSAIAIYIIENFMIFTIF